VGCRTARAAEALHCLKAHGRRRCRPRPANCTCERDPREVRSSAHGRPCTAGRALGCEQGRDWRGVERTRRTASASSGFLVAVGAQQFDHDCRIGYWWKAFIA
jgi:hypothetical protein